MGFYAKKLIRRVEDNVKYVEDLGHKKQIQGKRMIRSLAKKLIGEPANYIQYGKSNKQLAALEDTELNTSVQWYGIRTVK
jgi:hypothetical protein